MNNIIIEANNNRQDIVYIKLSKHLKTNEMHISIYKINKNYIVKKIPMILVSLVNTTEKKKASRIYHTSHDFHIMIFIPKTIEIWLIYTIFTSHIELIFSNSNFRQTRKSYSFKK